MRYLLTIALLLVVSVASAGEPPRAYVVAPPCPCGDTCQCPAGTCPNCPVTLTAAPVRVCDANGCRLVPASPVAVPGFAGAAALGQYQSYRQSTPFMHRGPVRSFLARLLGR